MFSRFFYLFLKTEFFLNAINRSFFFYAGLQKKGLGSTTPKSTTTTNANNIGLKDQTKVPNLRKATSESTLLSSATNLNQIVKNSNK